MIPVVSFVGRSESGKTTLLEKVIGELKSRGYRVGVIKHTPHGFDIDHEGKDTWRFAQAGADVVAAASANQIAFIERVPQEPDLDQMRALFEGKADIVLTEGFKTSNTAKILVLRQKQDREQMSYSGETLATVSPHLSPDGIPVFSPEEISDIVNLMVRQLWGQGQLTELLLPATLN